MAAQRLPRWCYPLDTVKKQAAGSLRPTHLPNPARELARGANALGRTGANRTEDGGHGGNPGLGHQFREKSLAGLPAKTITLPLLQSEPGNKKVTKNQKKM